MVENVLNVKDLQNANQNTPAVTQGFQKQNGLKQTTSFLGDLKGVLEVVRDITGLDVMGKVKEVTQAQKEQSSNAVKIESGIQKQMAQMPQQVQPTISFNLPLAFELINKGLDALPEDKTVKELKEELTESREILEPSFLGYLKQVAFLQ